MGHATHYIAKDNGYGIITVEDATGVEVDSFTYSIQEDGTTEFFSKEDPFGNSVAVIAAGKDRLRMAEEMVSYAQEV